MKQILLLLCLLSVGGKDRIAQAQLNSDPLGQSTQIIVVTTSDWNAVTGHLQRYERSSPQDIWHPVGNSIQIVVGKSGLGWGIGVAPTDDPKLRSVSDPVKHEGDGRAPAGVFALGTAFGYAPEALPGSNMPYLALTPSTECVDDPASKHYNRIVERPATPDWNSSEHMRSAGESYRWGIVVNHNANPPSPGRGSCIFLHIWKGPEQGTVGCTAMPQAEIEKLLTWLDPQRKPLLVQLPEQQYALLMPRWKLPTVISTAQYPRTSHSGSDTASNPYSQSATTHRD
jgi:D-alanyl-D-alanine dipeptidase